MKMKLPTGKQILFPGLILAVAAMGLLFFLQIRWMNNSLQAQNLRYRRGITDALNHVTWTLFDRLGLDRFDAARPAESLEEWKAGAEYPDLIRSIEAGLSGEDWNADRESGDEIYYLAGSPENTYRLTLDSRILYEQILLEKLAEYSEDYTYTIRYEETGSGGIADERENDRSRPEDPLIRAFLPRFIDVTVDKRHLENLIFSPRDFYFDRDEARTPPPEDKRDALSYYILEIDLNDGRGSAQFEQRLKRTNLGLIVSLSLVLVGIIYLLLRLYRSEENQRRVEQTFVASVSHELRTPIAVIKTASDNLSRGIISDGERVKSYGNVIGAEADRLNRMVEAILYYSRMEGSGKTNLRPELVNPRLFSEEVLANLRLTYPDALIEQETKGGPEEVLLDRDSYRLILENLVTNGILHGSGAGIRVRLESDIPARWRLIVEDDGPGLARKEQKHVFDPFIRGKGSEKKQVRGSGLGLYLVRTAAEAMGGSVTLESPYQFPVGRERSGCRFTLILPMGKEVSREPDTDDRG